MAVIHNSHPEVVESGRGVRGDTQSAKGTDWGRTPQGLWLPQATIDGIGKPISINPRLE